MIYYVFWLFRLYILYVFYQKKLSKLFISAFSYGYGDVFKLKMVGIIVRCKTTSHNHVDEYLFSEVLMIKQSSTQLLAI